MSDEPLTLASAVGRYLASLLPEERPAQQQDLSNFVRWYGAGRPAGEISITEVDDYVAYVESSGADSASRLESVRSFLIYAKRHGITATNLAVHIRVRRPGGKKGAASGRELRVVNLTAEGYAQLHAELEELVGQRPHMAEEIRRAAADKDFRENAPLDAAREHQGQVEARIRDLQSTLKAAQVTEGGGTGSAVAGLGSTVVLHDLAYDEEVRYTLVEPAEADPRRGKLSVASPTGKALLDRTVGEEIEVTAPGGAVHYRIVSVA